MMNEAFHQYVHGSAEPEPTDLSKLTKGEIVAELEAHNETHPDAQVEIKGTKAELLEVLAEVNV